MSAPVIPAAPMPPPISEPWPVDVPIPPQDLPEEDGENLESNWHRDAMNCIIELVRVLFSGRTDYFVGGNMFIHFSARQVRNLDFRGPDVFVVKDVDGTRQRRYWAVWEEEGRYPNAIFELLSPTTAKADRTTKKEVYERTFRTPEYFLYDPDTAELTGWRLDDHQRYQPIKPNAQGWLWSEQLGVWVGTCVSRYNGSIEAIFVRLFTDEGERVPLFAEKAEENARIAKERADEEKERADKAESELARIHALLAEKGIDLPKS